MRQAAAFWDPENGQESDVIRHAPDDHNYHYPDGRQLERMRSGIGMAVLVPKAKNDGRSEAFDGTKASVVHVDPDAPDGGAIVDLSQLRKADVNKALSTSRFPHQVYYKLGTSPAAEDVPQRKPARRQGNPLIAGGYVVPASDQQGRQVDEDDQGFADYKMAYQKEQPVLAPAPPLPPILPVHPQAQAPQQPQQQFVPQQQPQYPQQGQYPQAPPQYTQQQQPMYPQQPLPPQQHYYPPPDPALQSALGQLLGGMQAISSRLQAVENGRADEPVARPKRKAKAVNRVANKPMGKPPTSYGRKLTPIGQVPQEDEEDEEDDREHEHTRSSRSSKSVFEDVEEDEEDEEEEARPRPRSLSRPPRRVRKNKKVQHLDDMVDEDDGHREGMIVGFETLKMPYVSGPVGLKAKRRVFFDFGGTGKQSAFYHDVIESNSCVALVYDTRYENGTQFEPPDLEDAKIQLAVPHMKKTFQVSSMGFSFSMGVFDVIVLVKHEDSQLDYDEEP